MIIFFSSPKWHALNSSGIEIKLGDDEIPIAFIDDQDKKSLQSLIAPISGLFAKTSMTSVTEMKVMAENVIKVC